MEISVKIAGELINIWRERTIGSQESFGYLISTFLEVHPAIKSMADIKKILWSAKKMASEIAKEFPSGTALHISYKAFASALNQFIDTFPDCR